MDYRDYCELYHHGIKGQKWGVRRFQNEDGTLTPAGQKRYNRLETSMQRNSKAANILYDKARKHPIADTLLGYSSDAIYAAARAEKNRRKMYDLTRNEKAGDPSSRQITRSERDAKKFATFYGKSLESADKGDMAKAKKYAAKVEKTARMIAKKYAGTKLTNLSMSEKVLNDGRTWIGVALGKTVDSDGYNGFISTAGYTTKTKTRRN